MRNVRNWFNLLNCSTHWNMACQRLNMRLTRTCLIFWILKRIPKCIGQTTMLGLWLNISMALSWRQQNVLLKKPKYFSLTCNEISTIDNQSWFLVDDYVVQNWLRILIILSLKHVVVRSSVDNVEFLCCPLHNMLW